MTSRRGNGEGSIIHEKARGRWRAVYTDGVNENGTLIRKNIYGKTRQEVVERLNTIMYEKSHSKYVKKNGIKLIDIINSLIEQKYKLNLIADRQYKTLNQHKKRIEENKIAYMEIQKITTADIQEFLYTIVNYSQSYIRKLIHLINSAFEDAQKKNIIYTNPVQAVIIPKSTKETKVVRALTLEEQKKLTEYLINTSVYDEPYRLVFLIQVYMGLRIGETLALTNTDFDLDNDYVYVRRTLTEDKDGNIVMKDKTKTFSGKRDIKIPIFLKSFILEQIEISKHNRNGLLFTYRNQYVRWHSINSVLKRIFRTNLGLSDKGISSHVLRHTFATRLREAGIDIKVAQNLMGHADISETLNTYTEVQESFKISELEKMNDFITKQIDFEPKSS